MFPITWSKEKIESEIKLARVNPVTKAHASVDWAGWCRNGMIIGGRSHGNGAIKSAFPAFRDGFEIPG